METQLARIGRRNLHRGLVRELVEVFAAAFSDPPYFETQADFDAFAERLPRHARYPGFRAVTSRAGDGSVAGFAYGYTGGRHSWWWRQVRPALAPDAAERWLGDCFEFFELAVRPERQRGGLGTTLHDALLAGLPHATAVLSTIEMETPAMRLYRRRGWRMIQTGFWFPGAHDPYAILGLNLTGTGRKHPGG